MHKKLYQWGGILVFALVSCINVDSLNSMRNTNDVLLPEQFDYHVKIQDDIYHFVNGRWLDFNSIPPGRLSWSPVDSLIDRTENQLLTILKSLNQRYYLPNSNEFKLNLLFQKYLNQEQRNQEGIKPLQSIFSSIDEISNHQQLFEFINTSISEGKSNPFINLKVAPDFKKRMVYKLYILDPKTQLPPEYFNLSLNKNLILLRKYQSFIKNVLLHLNIAQAQELSKKIVAFEKKVSQYLNNEDSNLDFKVSFKEPSRQQEVIHFTKIILGCFSFNFSDAVLIVNHRYFHNLKDLLLNEDIETLKTYLKYYYFLYYSEYLDNNSYELVFNFMKKELFRQQKTFTLEHRAIDFVNRYMGHALGKLYVQRFFPPENKEQIRVFVHKIKKSFRSRLLRNTWMSQETIKKLIQKLDALTIKVGYPDQWIHYEQLQFTRKNLNLVEIVDLLDKWVFDSNQAKIGQSIIGEEWTTNPQTVNAYYDILKNEVIYPAAILQPPFFYKNSDPAVMFGTLGVLVGHEMTHGFDTRGFNDDGFGNQSVLWNAEDQRKYQNKAKKLVKQFNQYTVIDNVKVNGERTLNENIADLVGLNIAYDALMEEISKRKIEKISGFSQPQRFFLAWVSLFKGKISDQALRNSYSTYIHTPEPVRAFAPLFNMDVFYDTFQIEPGSKHYLQPQERVKIW